MSINLVLGLFALSISVITVIARFLLPLPEKTVADPYAQANRRSWFPVIAFGVVPLLASAAFLAAWWQESPTAHDQGAVARRPAPAPVVRQAVEAARPAPTFARTEPASEPAEQPEAADEPTPAAEAPPAAVVPGTASE